MEATEIIIYLVIALIIGSMVLLFIKGIDYKIIFNEINDIFTDNKKESYLEVNKEKAVSELYDFWQRCDYGLVNSSMLLYINQEGIIDKSYIFEIIKLLSFCETLQSFENECGKKEMIDMQPDVIQIPSVLKLKCDSTTNMLQIIG